MMQKICDYLFVVINGYFFVGMIIAYIARALIGGQVISLVTGSVFGLLLFEVIKFIVFKR